VRNCIDLDFHRMIDDMTVRNLSPATQQSYVYAVANFSRFFGKSPDQLRAGVSTAALKRRKTSATSRSWRMAAVQSGGITSRPSRSNGLAVPGRVPGTATTVAWPGANRPAG
jgi:hypothetical protein